MQTAGKPSYYDPEGETIYLSSPAASSEAGAAKKRKRGAEDDARDAEALQLALNRIASPPPREDGGALPLQERLDRAKASA